MPWITIVTKIYSTRGSLLEEASEHCAPNNQGILFWLPLKLQWLFLLLYTKYMDVICIYLWFYRVYYTSLIIQDMESPNSTYRSCEFHLPLPHYTIELVILISYHRVEDNPWEYYQGLGSRIKP